MPTTYEMLPLPTGAGVRVPVRGMRLALHRTDRNGYRGLGFIDIAAGLLSGVIGGIFGGESESRQLNAQKEMMWMQTQAYTDMSRLQSEADLAIAKMQIGAGDRQVEAAVKTAEIQARNERIAIESAYTAQLSAQRMQKQVAEEGLAAQLVSGTQSGIFGLAQEGIRQAGQVATSAPKATTNAAAIMVVGTVIALAWSMRTTKKRKPQKRKPPVEPIADMVTVEESTP